MSIYADSESLWQWASSNGSRHYSQIRAQRQRQIQTNCKTQVVQYLERAKQKGCDCNAPQLSCRQRYIPEGALERACTAGVTWFSLWWRSSFLAEELFWRHFPYRFLFHLKKKNLPAWLFLGPRGPLVEPSIFPPVPSATIFPEFIYTGIHALWIIRSLIKPTRWHKGIP